MLQGALPSPPPASSRLSLPSPAILFLSQPCVTRPLGFWVLSPSGTSLWKPLSLSMALAHAPRPVSVKTLWNPRGQLTSDQGQSSCINSAWGSSGIQ